jgi:hypothetical protein
MTAGVSSLKPFNLIAFGGGKLCLLEEEGGLGRAGAVLARGDVVFEGRGVGNVMPRSQIPSSIGTVCAMNRY